MAQASRYEQRVYQEIAKAMRRHMLRLVPKAIRSGTVVSPLTPGAAAKLLPELATLHGSSDYHLMANSKVAQLVRVSVRQTLTSSLTGPWHVQNRVADAVVKELLGRASILDLELRMPPIRREPAKRRPKPLTPKQRRAMAAAGKLKAWKRRMATAKTKVAMYRKKVNYYKKKGVLQS